MAVLILRRILIALAVLQAVFLITALVGFEQLYYEMNAILGLFVLTPLLGVGLGALLAYVLSERKWAQGLVIWVVCIVAAFPAYFLSWNVGEWAREHRLAQQNQRSLHEPERKLRELAAREGWTLQEYDLTPVAAYVVYERNGQRRLTYVRIDETAEPAADITLTDLEQAFAREFGAPVTLRPAALFNRRFWAAVSNREVVVEIRPWVDDRQWQLICEVEACPAQVDLTLPMQP